MAVIHMELLTVLILAVVDASVHAQSRDKSVSVVEDLNDLYPRSINFTFDPPEVIDLKEGEYTTLKMNITCLNCWSTDIFHVTARIEDKEVALIHNSTYTQLSPDNSLTTSGKILLKGVYLGKTTLSFTIIDKLAGMEDFNMTDVYRVHTLRKMRVLDILFIVIIATLVAGNTVAYACTLDLDIVKSHLKRPVGVLIGFFCQYGFMPLVAFGLAKAFELPNSLAFGLLCYGASPGGGSSNVWTILLRGDLNLSVSMTFISLVSSLGMTSMWIFTLGKQFTDDTRVPFHNIVISLVALLATVIIGLLIKQYAPKTAKCLAKTIKPMAVVIIIYVLTFGTYTNLYIFRLMNSWQVVLSAMLVSYVGYILSFTASMIFRRSWKVTRTIVIETGIQNGALAILMVKYSLPQPDGDLATVAPATALMTNGFPLMIYFVIQCIYRRYHGKPIFASSPDTESDVDVRNDQPKENEITHNAVKENQLTPGLDNGNTNTAFASSTSSDVVSTISGELPETPPKLTCNSIAFPGGKKSPDPSVANGGSSSGYDSLRSRSSAILLSRDSLPSTNSLASTSTRQSMVFESAV